MAETNNRPDRWTTRPGTCRVVGDGNQPTEQPMPITPPNPTMTDHNATVQVPVTITVEDGLDPADVFPFLDEAVRDSNVPTMFADQHRTITLPDGTTTSVGAVWRQGEPFTLADDTATRALAKLTELSGDILDMGNQDVWESVVWIMEDLGLLPTGGGQS